jgi:hypothetical protein
MHDTPILTTTLIALDDFALRTAADTGTDLPSAVRMMVDEPQKVALALGCPIEHVRLWCEQQSLLGWVRDPP